MRCACTQDLLFWATHDVLSTTEKPILSQTQEWGML